MCFVPDSFVCDFSLQGRGDDIPDLRPTGSVGFSVLGALRIGTNSCRESWPRFLGRLSARHASTWPSVEPVDVWCTLPTANSLARLRKAQPKTRFLSDRCNRLPRGRPSQHESSSDRALLGFGLQGALCPSVAEVSMGL